MLLKISLLIFMGFDSMSFGEIQSAGSLQKTAFITYHDDDHHHRRRA
jgi:hypothetical protein